MTLLVDTNVFLAGADAQDADHIACVRLLDEHPGPLVTTALAIAETGWLVERQLGASAEASFYRLVAEQQLLIEPARAGGLGTRY